MRHGITRRVLVVPCFALTALFFAACGGGEAETASPQAEAGEAAQSVKDTAAELEGNVEQSAEIMKETYEADRAAGEGMIEASGDAYEAVLEEGREKAEEKK